MFRGGGRGFGFGRGQAQGGGFNSTVQAALASSQGRYGASSQAGGDTTGGTSGAPVGKNVPSPSPTGRVRNPRKGLFYASDLLDSREAKAFEQEFPDLDKQVIMRFPAEDAAILRERFLNPEAGGLGLVITPTMGEDYRIFDISLERSLGHADSAMARTGVLVELPCVMESFKTLDGDLLFKSADVSQMVYVYDPANDKFDLASIRDRCNWEWPSGLTPGTRRIRTRKFRNFEVFDKLDTQMGEREILEILRGTTRDYTAVETVSLADKLWEVEAFHSNQPLAGSVNVVGIVDDNPALFDDAASDLSDQLFRDNEVPLEAEGSTWAGRPDAMVGDVESNDSSSSSSSAEDSQRDRKRREKRRKKKEKRRKRKEMKRLMQTSQQGMDSAVMMDPFTHPSLGGCAPIHNQPGDCLMVQRLCVPTKYAGAADELEHALLTGMGVD